MTTNIAEIGNKSSWVISMFLHVPFQTSLL